METESGTETWKLLQEASLLTNDIEKLLRLGTLYLTHLPRLLSGASVAPDGWNWVDFPYEDDYPMLNSNNEQCSLTPLLINLKYLAHRGHIKMTYRVIYPDLVCVRVYMVPSDIKGAAHLSELRTVYRWGKQISWHNAKYKKIMTNLLMVLDYDTSSWNGHWHGKDLIIFHFLKEYQPFDYKQIGTDFLGEPNHQIFNFHIKRAVNNEPFKDFSEELKEKDLETKLLDLYNGIRSPQFDLQETKISREQVSLVLNILNNEIEGAKSELYSYQKQSVAKMLEREYYPRRMTTFLGFKDHFLDITTLQFYERAEVYVTPRGGILAENMGLGKTFICLALICCSKSEISQIPEEFKPAQERSSRGMSSLMQLCIEKLNSESVAWRPYQQQLSESCLKALEENPGSFSVPIEEDLTRRKSNRISSSVEVVDRGRRLYLCNTTIVVVPDNLFHQWLLEMRKHIQNGFLKVLKLSNVNVDLPRSEELIKYDLVLMSNSVFARQAAVVQSPLKYVYWKRLIVDEGHSMNNKLSRAVYMVKNLFVERRWAISGTPTAGLTRLHMNEEIDDEMTTAATHSVVKSPKKKKNYVVKRKFDVGQDLNKLGSAISSFFQIDPWSRDPKLWSKQIVRPFMQDLFGSDLQLQKILTSLLVRHELSDVEHDVKLPALHHKTVFLAPSFHDTISLNVFTAVLATNAVTSERSDQDYMFHPSNRSELRRLVTNLQKATFYWTGFTINDVEVLISICELAKKKKFANGQPYYSARDVELLDLSIESARLALSNPRWRTASAIHEMSYFIKNLPTPFTRTLSTGVLNHDISVYGAPQLGATQAFFYKNRFLSDLPRLMSRLDEYTKPFWSNYWKDTERKNIYRSKNRDGQAIDSQSVSEALAPERYHLSNGDKRKFEAESETVEVPSTPRKALKTSTSKINKMSPRQMMQSEDGRIKTTNDNLINGDNDSELMKKIRSARILGSASSKLSYLGSRLLEHQLSGVKSIVFFEFEESAYYLTELLDLMGVNYLMYATFVKLSQRLSNLATFSLHKGEGITLVMDLKLAAHGLTIISATRVYFINPVWKQALEAQAIKRAHRIGQTNEVFVETLILRDTIEEEMFRKRMNDDKKPEKDVEAMTLIDDTGMQEFVSRHQFLKFAGSGDEICRFEAPITNETPILGNNVEDSDEGLAALLEAVGVVKGSVREWDLPLFSEANLILQNKNQAGKKPKSDDTEAGAGEAEPDDETEADRAAMNRLSLVKQLRMERASAKSVRFI